MGRLENLKSLFSNTRTRVLLVFTFGLLLTVVIVGIVKFGSSGNELPARANVARSPATITSIPGKLDQTAAYASLQEEQNIQQAKTASQKGGSAIPTIIRTHAFDTPGEVVGPTAGKGGVGFTTLALEGQEGPQRIEWLSEVRKQNCSQQSVRQVLNQGAKLSDLKGVCSCSKLKSYGYTLQDLKDACECKSLKRLGYTATQLKQVGFDAHQLYECGYSACEERQAGFSPQEMKDGGFSDGELKGAGFTPGEIARASGLPDGITADDVRKAGCNKEALERLRKAGVTAAAIRRISGCTPAQLLAAGFTPADLKRAGFTAAQLKNAGVTPSGLRNAGYSARDAMNAGVSPDALRKAGYSPDDIDTAEGQLPPGITPEDIKKAGCNPEALRRLRLAGVSAKTIREMNGCSAAALKAAGYGDQDLADAGFTPDQIKAASGKGVSDAAIRAAGCDPAKLRQLREEGVSAERIKKLNGCTDAQLAAAGYKTGAGVSDAAIRAAGCDPAKLRQLREEGVSAERIKRLNGCTDAQLAAAGYTPDEIGTGRGAGVSDDAIRAAGCDPAKLRQLREEGVTAKRIEELNHCTAAQLRAAGYGPGDLANAGFSPADLLKAGFTPGDLAAAGLKPAAVIAHGRTADCSVESLRAAHQMGVSAKTIRDTLGCSASAMRAAGYGAKALKDAGYSPAELSDAGFSPSDLKNAGFTAKELAAAGINPDALKKAGYGAKDLADAGFSPDELKKAGYTDADLKAAGLGPKETSVTPLQPKKSQELDSVLAATPTSAKSAQQKEADAQEQRLNKVLTQQQMNQAATRYRQKVQQETSAMMNMANRLLQEWKVVPKQAYVAADKKDKGKTGGESSMPGLSEEGMQPPGAQGQHPEAKWTVKTGDILFGVVDTAVNSDQPGPVLATVVTGALKGAKVIGSFNVPKNASTMVITFNTLSVPGESGTVKINAYAIDPETARTALSSRTNHHYLQRYGALFASSFLEGMGNAFQSADTTVSVGGTGGTTDTTVQNGIDRTTLDNAVIALGTVGTAWGEEAKKQFDRPTTVEVFSGTGIGILFTQDADIGTKEQEEDASFGGGSASSLGGAHTLAIPSASSSGSAAGSTR